MSDEQRAGDDVSDALAAAWFQMASAGLQAMRTATRAQVELGRSWARASVVHPDPDIRAELRKATDDLSDSFSDASDRWFRAMESALSSVSDPPGKKSSRSRRGARTGSGK